MLKKLTLLITILWISASVINAQAKWTNQGAWPNNTWVGQNHATAIDPDGKIWVGKYASQNFVKGVGDTVKGVYLLYVFNPDGTQASFSPLWKFTSADGKTINDTMKATTNRGMRLNIDGNIIVGTGGPALYILNYKTGAALKKAKLTGTPAAPCVSNGGTIYVAPVTPGAFPLTMYDQNLTVLGTAIQTTIGYSRSFEVSKDGNTIYWSGYTNGKIFIYTRPDEFSSFALKDSILNGMHSESITYHPITGYLWLSGGSSNDVPTNGFSPFTWYGYNLTTKKVVDSLKYILDSPTSDERPRALAFSPDGKSAYLGSFGTGTAPLLEKVTYSGTFASVKKLDELPTGYTLSQNYPNPFNPTTNIKFSIPNDGIVTLKVYNTLGQEVATLLNEYKATGTYAVDFNAANYASGMYVYTLSVGNTQISKKMLLMK